MRGGGSRSGVDAGRRGRASAVATRFRGRALLVVKRELVTTTTAGGIIKSVGITAAADREGHTIAATGGAICEAGRPVTATGGDLEAPIVATLVIW